MTALLKIALRNIFRNKKRSLITLVAVSFGLSALIFLRSFMYGAQTQMIDNITRTLTSDAQIVPKALENIYNTNAYLENADEIREIIKKDPRIEGAAERVIAAGIVASATSSMPTYIVGGTREMEDLIKSKNTLVEGRDLGPEDEHSAIIGKKMREVLGVNLGDKIVLTSQDYYGSMSGEALKLVGTFETGNDQIDNGTIVIRMATAQRLLSIDQKISKFAIKVRDGVDVDKVVRDLRLHITDPNTKVLTWEELIPMMAQLIQFQNGTLFVVVMIVLVVVAAGILNTLMMSIIERIREFGLMMALGTTPGQVIFLVVSESFILTMLGAVIGFGVGISVSIYLGHQGIDLTSFVSTFSNFLIGSHVYPKIDWAYMVLFVVVVFISNILVSFYPAWRASKLVPVDAMRQVG
ncbi:MAG: ABC transporter permease [Deltaproteobacteria bacterium]|nr:MAG: ABC transporter permease [Deltaproteobacteria bacterium]